MATITINIPVDKEVWVLNGLGVAFNYQTNIPNPDFDDQVLEDPETNPSTIPNTESKASFVKKGIINIIIREATQGHINNHWETERNNAETVTLT